MWVKSLRETLNHYKIWGHRYGSSFLFLWNIKVKPPILIFWPQSSIIFHGTGCCFFLVWSSDLSSFTATTFQDLGRESRSEWIQRINTLNDLIQLFILPHRDQTYFLFLSVMNFLSLSAPECTIIYHLERKLCKNKFSLKWWMRTTLTVKMSDFHKNRADCELVP